jgi:hypothetical protein
VVEPVTPRQNLTLIGCSILTPARTARIKTPMKILTVLLAAILLAGCAGPRPKGSARFDEYDAVKIEQMTGNNVSRRVLQKTIVCLNARRETRPITALTNSIVTTVTNQTVNAVTNITVSTSTNLVYSIMTNLSPALPVAVVTPSGDAATETNAPAAAAPASAALSTNLTISVANNASGTVSPNQRQASSQMVRTLNNQLTSSSNNLSVALMTNMVVTAETNLVVNYATNTSIVSVTNVIVTPTNGVAYDYFLFTEMMAPPDFTPVQQGETLVLLIDGVRHAFANAQSSAAVVSRKGFATALYRVTPETLVALANAKEVRLRVRGATSVIERGMNDSSRKNFRDFVLKFFTTPEESGIPKQVSVPQDSQSVASR